MQLVALILLGTAAELGWIGVVRLGDLRLRFPEFLGLFGAVAMAVVLAGRSVRGLGGRRSAVVVLLGFSFLFRATMILSFPSLSDDVYRYVWEGRLVLEGRNPYDLPPNAPEHADLRDELHGRINHPEMTAVYPPAAMLVFAVSQGLGHGVLTVKLLAVAFDIFLILLLMRLLRLRGHPQLLAVLYAWHPLPILEFAGSGHLDVFAISLLVGGLLLLELGKLRSGIIVLSLSGLTKLLAFSLAPAVARRSGWRTLAGIGGPLIVVAFLPFIGAGAGLFRSLARYAESWSFNGSIFPALRALLGDGQGARLIVVALFIAIAWLLPRWVDDPLRVASVIAGAFVLLSPTVHPWYLTWVVPFMCFRVRASWLWLSLAVVCSYQAAVALVTLGSWIEVPWVRWFEYSPFFGLLLFESAGAAVRRARGAGRRDQRHDGAIRVDASRGGSSQ